MSSPNNLSGLTHFDGDGKAHMVDVGEKPESHRIAIAAGVILMQDETLETILAGTSEKGDVLGIARIAAIQAGKKTGDLIPLCHPIPLTRMAVEFEITKKPPSISCSVTAETVGRTGVEMEALTGVSVALLTIYDMCKSIDRAMSIESIQLYRKSGGRSGQWIRPDSRKDNQG